MDSASSGDGGKETPLLALSSRSDVKRKAGVAQAAWKLEDALNDSLASAYPTEPEARDLHLAAAAADVGFGRALLLLVALTAVEAPAWCDGGGPNGDGRDPWWVYAQPAERCKLPPGVPSGELLLSDLPYIPPGWGLAVEAVLIALVAKKLILERRLQLRHFNKLGIPYMNQAANRFGLAMVVLEAVDIAVYATLRPRFRLAFIARCGCMVLLPSVRRLLFCIRAVIAEFLSIAAFYAGTVVFFAWIAAVMFDDLGGKTVNGEPVNKGLDTFGNTLNSMFVAGSTDDFVGIFLNSYTAHRATGLLWLLFLVIVQILLLNLVLDTLVAAYTRYQERKEELDGSEALAGIREAFHTLGEATGEGREMSRGTFLEFVRELTKSPRVRYIPCKSADIIFRALDRDGSGHIDEVEFFGMCGVIQYSFWTTPDDSPLKERLPQLWRSAPMAALRDAAKGGLLDGAMDVVLVVNLLLVVWESVYDLHDWPETPAMEQLELCFAFVYVAEVAAKLSVWDMRYYWSFRSNQFDFFTTWLLLGSSLLDLWAASAAGGDVKRYMNILRLLRLLRVLKQLKGVRTVQLMVETMCNIVCASKHIMALLGVVTFFFAALSVQLWGGLLYKSNPDLEGSGYAEKRMFVLNFNDFGTACGVWIVTLLCEYVPVFPDAINRVSGLHGSWFVFVLFYIGGVSVVFELVKAFTIEAFLELHKGWARQQAEPEALAGVRAAFDNAGLVLHYRVVGDLGAHDKVMRCLQESANEERSKQGGDDHRHGRDCAQERF